MMSCNIKASGAQRRKREAEQAKEDHKLRRVLESYVKSTADIERQAISESGQAAHDAVRDIDQSESVDQPEENELTDAFTDSVAPDFSAAPSTTESDSNSLVILHKDVGFLTFLPVGCAVIDRHMKEQMVQLGAGYLLFYLLRKKHWIPSIVI